MNLQNKLAFIDESRRWRSGAPVGRVDSSNDIISNACKWIRKCSAASRRQFRRRQAW